MSEYTQFKPIREDGGRGGSSGSVPQAAPTSFFSRLFKSSTAPPPAAAPPALSSESISPERSSAPPPPPQPAVPRPWMPDELVNRCHSCDLSFTAVRRRHHCRVCGQIFCNACSDNYVDRSLLGFNDHEVVRVCNFCLRSRNQQMRMTQLSTPQKRVLRDSEQPQASARRNSPANLFGPRQTSLDSDLESSGSGRNLKSPTGEKNVLSDVSEGDNGDSEDEWRTLSATSKSFWDEEAVPSYPIDRRVSVITAPSRMSALDTSISIGGPVHELRKESKEHLSRVVATLLESDPVLSRRSEEWSQYLCKLATKAAAKVMLRAPDVMDVTEYVRVKLVTGGDASDSHHVRGVVLRDKTVVHTAMRSHMLKPRILLMGCAVQFARPDWRFVEFDVLQVQERDFLRILVDRIAALKPDLLVTSESISSLALEFLMDAGITCVSRVNVRDLERLSRFSGASIMRNLSDFHAVELGHDCGLLKDVTAHTPTGVRRFLYFEDCPAGRGGTVVLRGADTQVLHALKKVLKFAVSTAYHLRLEDAFVSDLSLHMVSTARKAMTTSSNASSPRQQTPVSMSPSVTFVPPVAAGAAVPVGFWSNRGLPDLLTVLSPSASSVLSVNFEYEEVLRGMQEQHAVSLEAPRSILENQTITYCFSQHQSEKRSHCIAYQYHHIPFYSKMDMPLISFLRWSCLPNVCQVQACAKPHCEHESSFLYGNKRMFVSTSSLSGAVGGPSVLPSNDVLCWFGCNECVETSQPKSLSLDAQQLSLGKLMELLFLDRSLSCSVGHQLNPNGTLVFSYGDRLVSFSFMRIPVYGVEPPLSRMRPNSKVETALVEKELSALAAAAHISYAVIKKRVLAVDVDVLGREEGDFLQSVNDAKRSRLLQINQLFRVLLTNVMRWQGSLEASAAAAAAAEQPEATPSTRRLLGMSISTGQDGMAAAAAAAATAAMAATAAERSSASSSQLVASSSSTSLAGGSSSTSALVEALLPEKPDAPLLARLIKKSAPQVPQLQSEIAEAMAVALSKDNTMYQLFSGRGAPMPLSSLTNEVVVVLDAEPSSHIACALGTDQYHEQMHDILGPLIASASESGGVRSVVDLESMSVDLLRRFALSTSGGTVLPNSIKVAFECMLPRLPYVCDVTIYYPIQFAALRRVFCGGEAPFVYSMARSQSWAAKEEGGGASKVFFFWVLLFLWMLCLS
jgi:hypothetical protein